MNDQEQKIMNLIRELANKPDPAPDIQGTPDTPPRAKGTGGDYTNDELCGMVRLEDIVTEAIGRPYDIKTGPTILCWEDYEDDPNRRNICPICGHKHRFFVDAETQTYWCLGRGECKGNAYRFVLEAICGGDTKAAHVWLKKRAGVYTDTAPRENIADNAGGGDAAQLPPSQPAEDDLQTDVEGFRYFRPSWQMKVPKPDVLVTNTMHKGEIVMISGASKAGKTFYAMELAACVQNGRRFHGEECTKGDVLYVNAEVQDGFFDERLKDIMQHLGCTEFIEVINTNRGKDTDALVLELKYRERVHLRETSKHYSLIVIDTLYNFFTADENSATDTKTELSTLASVADEYGSAIAIVHHHSKNPYGYGEAEMASGSGVFSRFPDDIINLLKIVPPPSEDAEEGTRGIKISYTQRNFGAHKEQRCRWAYPLFIDDLDGSTRNWTRPMTASEKDRRSQIELDKDERYRDELMMLKENFKPGEKITATEIKNLFGWASLGTVTKHIQKFVDSGDLTACDERGKNGVKYWIFPE